MGKLYYPSDDLFKIVCFFHKLLKGYNNCMSSFDMKRCINYGINHFSGNVFREHTELVEIGEETHELKVIKMIGFLFF